MRTLSAIDAPLETALDIARGAEYRVEVDTRNLLQSPEFHNRNRAAEQLRQWEYRWYNSPQYMDRTSLLPESDFWHARMTLNREKALPYQWSMYEKVGTVDNFRIAAGLKKGHRRGFFYTDSDLHKWADATCRSLAETRLPGLETTLAEYVSLMAAAQTQDGYLYTYNQIEGNGQRWQNLLVEHELYCHGHFIEAGIEHAAVFEGESGGSPLLRLAMQSADLICKDFSPVVPNRTPGHQEIEIALFRLHRLTGIDQYYRTGMEFLNARGKMRFPGIVLARQDGARKKKALEIQRRTSGEGVSATPANPGYDFHETSHGADPALIRPRLVKSFLTGQYMQQHKPLSRQKEPVGHSVRWAYMMTAAAMSGHGYLDVARSSLERMLRGKTYVSGGIGSLPLVEGFGRRWELSDETAYCETCAAIGSIFLCHELSGHSTDARYADLLEWQLYNAASVGIGLDGTSYFYRNPLLSRGGVRRRPWFDTACCPSNISRLWGSVGRYVCSLREDCLFVNQYVSGRYVVGDGAASIEIQSTVPWSGETSMQIANSTDRPMQAALRIPSWAAGGSFRVDGHQEALPNRRPAGVGIPDFGSAGYRHIRLAAGSSVSCDLALKMEINVMAGYSRVRGQRNRFAVGRGPLLYCLESPGRLGEESPDPVLATESLEYTFDHTLLGGVGIIRAMNSAGNRFSLVPYYAWGNREDGAMRVWLKADGADNR
jgi:uncharacterized protein